MLQIQELQLSNQKLTDKNTSLQNSDKQLKRAEELMQIVEQKEKDTEMLAEYSKREKKISAKK